MTAPTSAWLMCVEGWGREKFQDFRARVCYFLTLIYNKQF
jgi:hypothetical protein